MLFVLLFFIVGAVDDVIFFLFGASVFCFFIIFAQNLYTMKRKEYIGVVATGSKKCSVANIAPLCLAGNYFFI